MFFECSTCWEKQRIWGEQLEGELQDAHQFFSLFLRSQQAKNHGQHNGGVVGTNKSAVPGSFIWKFVAFINAMIFMRGSRTLAVCSFQFPFLSPNIYMLQLGTLAERSALQARESTSRTSLLEDSGSRLAAAVTHTFIYRQATPHKERSLPLLCCNCLIIRWSLH